MKQYTLTNKKEIISPDVGIRFSLSIEGKPPMVFRCIKYDRTLKESEYVKCHWCQAYQLCLRLNCDKESRADHNDVVFMKDEGR